MCLKLGNILPSKKQQVAIEAILASAAQAIHERGQFHIVLAGGNTPRAIYRGLCAVQTDWPAWHIYFGDIHLVRVDPSDVIFWPDDDCRLSPAAYVFILDIHWRIIGSGDEAIFAHAFPLPRSIPLEQPYPPRQEGLGGFLWLESVASWLLTVGLSKVMNLYILSHY